MDLLILAAIIMPWGVIILVLVVLFRGIRAIEEMTREMGRLGERLDVSDKLRDHFAGFQDGIDNAKLLESMNRRMGYFEDAMLGILEAGPGRQTIQIVGHEMRLAVKRSRLADLEANLSSRRRQLTMWEQNLNRLQERKAAQGIDADIRLVNQIEATSQAVRQARDDIREIENEMDQIRADIAREEVADGPKANAGSGP
jgi:DNA repair exonuclease SbcCD ATPase subunit